MEDRGPSAPLPTPVAPAAPPAPLMQLPVSPAQQDQTAQPPLKWSHFKPEF